MNSNELGSMLLHLPGLLGNKLFKLFWFSSRVHKAYNENPLYVADAQGHHSVRNCNLFSH